jgi:hypothetical protein
MRQQRQPAWRPAARRRGGRKKSATRLGAAPGAEREVRGIAAEELAATAHGVVDGMPPQRKSSTEWRSVETSRCTGRPKFRQPHHWFHQAIPVVQLYLHVGRRCLAHAERGAQVHNQPELNPHVGSHAVRLLVGVSMGWNISRSSCSWAPSRFAMISLEIVWHNRER